MHLYNLIYKRMRLQSCLQKKTFTILFTKECAHTLFTKECAYYLVYKRMRLQTCLHAYIHTYLHTYSVHFEWVEIVLRSIRFVVSWSYALPATAADIIAIFRDNTQVRSACFYVRVCMYVCVFVLSKCSFAVLR